MNFSIKSIRINKILPEIPALKPVNGGFILSVHKPVGATSFRVVAYIKRLTGVKKVGHAGTLDPQADGVLLIVAGAATKQVEQLMTCEKEYIGTVRFGFVSDTYDAWGKVTECSTVGDLSVETVAKALEQFKGEIEQKAPVYSALKYKGKPMYSYARKGIEVEPKIRTVNIYSIGIESFRYPDVVLRIICSRGTYIRSIAHELGESLGCGAILQQLTRTRIGDFCLKDSVTWDEIPGVLTALCV